MREAGKLVARALRICREMAKPGTRTVESTRPSRTLVPPHNATPLFKGYARRDEATFPAVTCISLNEQVVHGIPGQRAIREGDLLKVDTACKLNGWCADAAITLPIGEVRPEKRRLVEGRPRRCCNMAMVEMGRRSWWSEVAGGCSIRAGVGRLQRGRRSTSGTASAGSCTRTRRCRTSSAEDLRKRTISGSKPGLVLAVEPMVNMGKGDTRHARAITGRW